MFSSFRSRRVVESEVTAVTPLEPTSLEALAQELPEFVPTLDASVPALPHRDLTADDVTDTSPDDVMLDGAAVLDTSVAPDDVEEAELVVPGLADDLDDATTPVPTALPSRSALPTRAVDPLNDEWAVEEQETAAAATEPVELVGLAEPADVPTGLPADQPLVALLAPEPDPEPAPHEAEELVTATALHAVDDVQAGVQARSTLSELARETAAQAPGEAPAPVEATVVTPAPAPVVPVIPTGTPAMDILPSRSTGRGLHLRRTSRPKASRPGRSAHLPDLGARSDHATPPVTPAAHSSQPAAPTAPTARPEDASPFLPSRGGAHSALAGAPAPAGPGEAPTAVAAPSSLFAPAPVPVAAPAPAPAPVEPVHEAVHEATPTPAFPAASLPALVAAQSLRERSAMASEALSELSALSSYRPESMAGASAPASLVRRTPQATPAAQISAPQEPQGQRRVGRNAADVRSMLSGFRAGVERGRTSPTSSGAPVTTPPYAGSGEGVDEPWPGPRSAARPADALKPEPARTDHHHQARPARNDGGSPP
jgi:hypothetical protein